MEKETNFSGKKGLFLRQKRPISMAKDPQERPISKTKETYFHGIRDLFPLFARHRGVLTWGTDTPTQGFPWGSRHERLTMTCRTTTPPPPVTVRPPRAGAAMVWFVLESALSAVCMCGDGGGSQRGGCVWRGDGGVRSHE